MALVFGIAPCGGRRGPGRGKLRRRRVEGALARFLSVSETAAPLVAHSVAVSPSSRHHGRDDEEDDSRDKVHNQHRLTQKKKENLLSGCAAGGAVRAIHCLHRTVHMEEGTAPTALMSGW